jgi:LacI family gluconate utilization system Gnt-I transcriptional repressor
MKVDQGPSPRQRRGHGRPTLHDVADAAGVTRITVSRFMRSPHLVAAETSERIKAAIDQTGYVLNLQAGQLASGNSHIVAALIPNVGHSIFAETVQALAEGLHGSGYELLLISTGYSMEREEQQLRALIGWAPAAFIVTGRHHTAGSRHILGAASSSGTPVVEIWDHPKNAAHGDGFALIGFDHRHAGKSMAQHLLAQGHTSLAYVDSGVAEDFRAHERGEGFAAEARRAGASVKIVRAPTGDAFDAGRRVLEQFVSKGRKAVTGVAFSNDHLACGALLQAQETHIEVPGQLALMGFGDFPIGRQLRPGMSTLLPPRADIGRTAVEEVLRSLASGNAASSRELPCELIVRGSTLKGSS